jgi:hypothetical protein
VESPDLPEISGIALSNYRADAFWAHNDSGNSAELFLVSTDGRTLARFKLLGATALDWEDICTFELGDQGYIAIGDVGDNSKRRASVRIYLLPEPKIDSKASSIVELQTSDFKAIDFTYTDGPRDCEAMAFDRTSRSFWMVERILQTERTDQMPGIYFLKMTEQLEALHGVARRIGKFPRPNVTGMDFSRDNYTVVVRDYFFAHLMTRNAGQRWRELFQQGEWVTIPLPLQRQGEAVCFSQDAKSIIVASEFLRQPIWQVDLEAAKRLGSKSDSRQLPEIDSQGSTDSDK